MDTVDDFAHVVNTYQTKTSNGFPIVLVDEKRDRSCIVNWAGSLEARHLTFNQASTKVRFLPDPPIRCKRACCTA